MKKINIAFLDRDGVINLKNFNNGYIGLLKHFRWVKGAIKAIKFLNKKNYKVVVVTNQSGVARGLYTINDVNTNFIYNFSDECSF